MYAACQQAEVHQHTKTPLDVFNPIQGFCTFHVHVKLVGPLPFSQGFENLLKVGGLNHQLAGSLSFVIHNVCECGSRVPFCMGISFWLPSNINSDRGPQFFSEL